MKKDYESNFFLLLIPSWIISVFFFIVFLINIGWPPNNPKNIYDLSYLIISIFLFLLPFISRLKLGKLIEFEREINETNKNLEHIRSDICQISANINIANAVAGIGNIYINPTEGEVASGKIKQKTRTPIEFKILNTLWNRQVLKFPKLNKYFTFRINAGSPEFLQFREAGNRLLGERLISETDTGQFFLTKEGLNYCVENYKDFPPDMYFNYISLDEQNLEIIKQKLR